MSLQEVVWRARTRTTSACDHARSLVTQPSWRREHLLDVLDQNVVPSPLVDALRRRQWAEAHILLSAFLTTQPQRFLISPSLKATLARQVLSEFAKARDESSAKANRILTGEYDLLGYRGLGFQTPGRQIDWHWDPVHRRRMPQVFWARVPYLDPLNGDHKIVWELNRHQHWIALGRAYWLTGDRRYRTRFIDELASWLAANPPLRGINWASMLELGMRALSWTWALNSFVAHDLRDESPWAIDLLVALDRQLAHIERHLSFYFSPNTHLLGEALGLYVAGQALPFLRASKARAALGRQILVDEIDRQIAADGGHRERSSHYHRYTLDFYLIALAIARIVGDAAATRLADAVERLSIAALALSDDRGRLAHFGDDDGGTALPICERPLDDIYGSVAIADGLLDRRRVDHREETTWFLAHPMFTAEPTRPSLGETTPSRSTALPELGYFVSRWPAGLHAVIHAGPHGYLNGGHAHADALSLTVTIGGTPLLVDPGTGAYTTDARVRDQFRSTKSHNTVTVDGGNQSTPDGPFHWKSRAATTPLAWQAVDGFDYFEAAHDGYRPAIHRRHVLSVHDDLLIVMDLVFVPDGRSEEASRRSHTIAEHWHVDPRWRVRVSPGRAALSLGQDRVELFAPTGELEHFVADSGLGLGWLSPVYGRIEPGSTLRIAQTVAAPAWSLSIFSMKTNNPVSGVECLTPGDDARGCDVWPPKRLGCGVRIVRERSIDYALVVEPAAAGAPKIAAFDEISTDARACFCRVVQGHVTDVSLVGGAQVTVNGSGRSVSLHSVELVS
jgi:uncharacterized heparinase superfamily protein